MAQFKLSAQLAGHDQDVRAVCFPSPDVVLSASRDQTVRLWKRTSNAPPSFEAQIATQGHDYINSVIYLKPSQDFPDGLIASGGKDAIIEVRRPGSHFSDNAERLLIGHAGNVVTLDASPDGKFLVSGGLDGQARVWSIGKWETEMVLEGHNGKGIWGVLAFDDHTVLTCCADQMIRGYDLRTASAGEVQPTTTIYTPDILRALCRVPKGHPSGADIATASNDGVIRLWSVRDGKQIAEMHGHESFIYSLAALPSGELVSSGEDRTVRVWKGLECVQTITHPAISVWSVAVCPENGDIVSGASDNVVRVFTRSEDRIAAADALSKFDDAVKASSIPQQQVGSINKEKLPGPDFLKSKSGTKEGQIQMIREEDGSISAHQWSISHQQWINVGTVVDSAGSSGRKVEYNGKSYDYVFDVDIKDGEPPLKLPYNLSENPYERATKFLSDNELPMTYLDNVANFIVENTKGATLGQTSSQPGPDPYGTESRYIPGQESQQAPSKPSLLSQDKYITLAQAKFPPIEKKILSVNAELIKTGEKQHALNPTEEATFKDLIQLLTTETTKIPAYVSAAQSPAAFPIPEDAADLVVKLITTWPYAHRLAPLDLLRCMCPSPAIAGYTSASKGSILDLALSSALEPGIPGSKPNENSVMMALRCVTNLFVTEQGRAVAASRADQVISVMECILGVSEYAGVAGPIGTTNRLLFIALTSAAVNFAVLFHKEQQAGGSATVGLEAVSLLINVLGQVLKGQSDAEIVFRALVALGTILSAKGDGADAATIAKDLGAADWARQAKSQASESRVKDVADEVLKLLR